jgi:hypothetical protein
VAWHLKREEIQHTDPSETKNKFLYHIRIPNTEKNGDISMKSPGSAHG